MYFSHICSSSFFITLTQPKWKNPSFYVYYHLNWNRLFWLNIFSFDYFYSTLKSWRHRAASSCYISPFICKYFLLNNFLIEDDISHVFVIFFSPIELSHATDYIVPQNRLISVIWKNSFHEIRVTRTKIHQDKLTHVFGIISLQFWRTCVFFSFFLDHFRSKFFQKRMWEKEDEMRKSVKPKIEGALMAPVILIIVVVVVEKPFSTQRGNWLKNVKNFIFSHLKKK